MATYRLNAEDVDPLLEGLAIQGTGGGGSPDWGREILVNDLARGRSLEIIDPDDLPDSSLVVSGGIMGSVKTFEQIGVKELVQHWETDFELLRATRTMEHYLHRSVDYVVPFEVGGLNTPVILSLAARLGTAAVNGDALGRSAPETQMTSFIMHGISLTPMPLVDAAGNAIVVTEQDQPTFADEIGRWMVTRGGGMGANNHYPMSGADLKRTVVPGTITQAMEIGRELQRARAVGEDPVAAASAVLGARPLFRGVVADVSGEDVGGFYITNVVLDGRGGYAGGPAKLVIKNETMALWVDGALRAVFPDHVCMLDPATGRGIMSVEITEGTEMALVGYPCHARLRSGLSSAAGQVSFGGARYGHPQLGFAPIEELNAQMPGW